MLKRAALLWCCTALPALAQTDDRSYLTAFLEDNLSGAGRKVVITGFEGALSSQARIAELTIADQDGVWLTLREVVLDWNRAALFSGIVSVNELSASEIILTRLPQTSDSVAASPEAGSFALPDLPVSVEIGKVAAKEIDLGPQVLGQPVEGRLEAALSLAGGEGAAEVILERQDDGPAGRLALKASFSNQSRQLALDLDASEGANGLVATAFGLPGRPSAELTIHGEGPFSAFSADIHLATDTIPRLTGRVVTQAAIGQTGFAANLSGDLAPLFLPEYAAFFGPEVTLIAQGTAHEDGRLDLSKLRTTAAALDLEGSLSLGADKGLRRFDLRGRIARPDGSPVLLPLATDVQTRVQAADIHLSHDRDKGEGWTASATVTALNRNDLAIDRLALTASGRIAPGQLGATLRFDAQGLQPTDAALARALGPTLFGEAVLFRPAGSTDLSIPKLALHGETYRATLTGAQISGLSEGLAVTGKLTGVLEDLSRFDAMAGLPLAGAAAAEITGRIEPLTGAFDLSLRADGQDMQTGNQALDGLLQGKAQLSADLTRDQSGVRIVAGDLQTNGVNGQLEGVLSSTSSDLSAKFSADLSAMGRGFGGGLQAAARLTGPLQTSHVEVTANGRDLRMGNAEVDKLLVGESRLSANLDLRDGKLQINRASLGNSELTADVKGLADGSQQVLEVQARLRNLALILPEFPGALTLSGKVVNGEAGAGVNLKGQGPGGIDATVTGRLAAGFGAGNLALRGRAQAALANAFILPRSISGPVSFDLALNGPLEVSSLSGQLSLEGGRFADPSLAFAFEGITARANLAGGRAAITASLPLTTSGKASVSGTIGLSEPFSADLGIGLDGITLRDPDLYETRLRGTLQLTGPLLVRPLVSGRIDLIETEIRVPSTGFGGAAGLPDLQHRNEPGDVNATRRRAGLLEEAAAAARSGRGDLAFDLLIAAPSRLFLRGRGLDAELGGEMRLRGMLSNIQPEGAFDLIRGRLEILGKRFDLSEALLRLEGDLVPFLRVVASTDSADITANVVIEGSAADPEISFTSMPELPEEEVLAQLLFGQGLQNLSALQALQLANAVATLAGKGGDGILTKLRQGAGLDNLDVKTTEDGGAEVTAGKYIGKNTYTEVTVDQKGKSQINLNLDLTDSITLRGKAGSDGQTGIGIFVEKDY